MCAWYTVEEIQEDIQKYIFSGKKIIVMISGLGVLLNKKIFAPQIMMILFAFLLVFSFCFNFLFRLSFFSQISWVYSVRSEKAMAPHSSTLAWKIPWMEEPGRLPSMGSLRVGHSLATSLSLFTFMHWRRKWQPTPVFLPGESRGWGSLLGFRLWGRTESDTTEVT